MLIAPDDNHFNDFPHWYFSTVIDFHRVIMSGPVPCFHCVRQGWGGQPVWTGDQQRGGWMGAMTPLLSLSKTVISISVHSPGPWQTLPSFPTLFSLTSTGLYDEAPHKRLFSVALTVFPGASTGTNAITYIFACFYIASSANKTESQFDCMETKRKPLITKWGEKKTTQSIFQFVEATQTWCSTSTPWADLQVSPVSPG